MYNVNENKEVIKPVLALSNPSSTNITVYVGDNSNTATGEQTQQHYYKQHVNSNNLTEGGIDYNSGPYFITGVMRLVINISITNDNILEENETFLITISHDSLSGNKGINLTVGNYSQATVTIMDTTSE